MNITIAVCQSCGASNRVPAAKQHLGPKCGKCGAAIDMAAANVPVELDDSNQLTGAAPEQTLVQMLNQLL